MRVLMVHNFYTQPGGEDVVFASERELLRDAGHEVATLTEHNRDVGTGGLSAAVGAVWNRSFRERIRTAIGEFGPDVVHFHNTMPLVSPAALRAAWSAGAAVVLTLHNYRLMCPSGLLFREGSVCETCAVARFPWAGVARACYRGSRLATAAVGATQATHRILGTWRRRVDRFIALTEFAREKFVRWGLPADRVAVKPNFVPAHEARGGGERDGVLFVGRLTPEKGIPQLLDAARRLAGRYPIRIAGDGPLAAAVKEVADTVPRLEWLGHCDKDRIGAELDRAACLAFPSTWYEGMPMTILEALAAGVPVIGSDCGAIPDIVVDGVNGRLFRSGNAEALANTLDAVLASPSTRGALAQGAHESYLERFTPERNMRALESIYTDALDTRRAHAASRA